MMKLLIIALLAAVASAAARAAPKALKCQTDDQCHHGFPCVSRAYVAFCEVTGYCKCDIIAKRQAPRQGCSIDADCAGHCSFHGGTAACEHQLGIRHCICECTTHAECTGTCPNGASMKCHDPIMSNLKHYCGCF